MMGLGDPAVFAGCHAKGHFRLLSSYISLVPSHRQNNIMYPYYIQGDRSGMSCFLHSIMSNLAQGYRNVPLTLSHDPCAVDIYAFMKSIQSRSSRSGTRTDERRSR
jgi:hypothetical protein